MLKDFSTAAHHLQGCTGGVSHARAWSVPPEAGKSARLHRRTMNKVVAVRPAYKAVVQGSADLPRGRRVKRRLQMHLAPPTSPASAVVSSDIMKESFSATCLAFSALVAKPYALANEEREEVGDYGE